MTDITVYKHSANKTINKKPRLFIPLLDPSSDKLKHLMHIHGGNYEHYLSKTRVTHVIATRLPNSKVKELKGNDKIVKPEWILDR